MKRWTQEEKEEALRIYRVDGPNAAAKETGIPRGTISSWARTNGDTAVLRENVAANIASAQQRWAIRREQMLAELGDVAELALSRTKEALKNYKGRDAKDYATTMAILADKAQLLSGGATSRPHVDTGQLVNDAKAKVLSLVPQRRRG